MRFVSLFMFCSKIVHVAQQRTRIGSSWLNCDMKGKERLYSTAFLMQYHLWETEYVLQFHEKMNSSFSTAFHCYYQFLLLLPLLHFQLVFWDIILFYINSAVVKKITMPTFSVPHILKLFLFIMLKINAISSHKKSCPMEELNSYSHI